MERIARQDGITTLHLNSSLNAEPFYAALGYQKVGECEYPLRSGVKMTAVKMVKHLDTATLVAEAR
jgi:hypothetical protein